MQQFAIKLGVTIRAYRGLENDDGKVPVVALGKLTLTDKFLILRRRSERTVASLAEEIGCCTWWFRQMEKGDVDSNLLQAFWGLAL